MFYVYFILPYEIMLQYLRSTNSDSIISPERISVWFRGYAADRDAVKSFTIVDAGLDEI